MDVSAIVLNKLLLESNLEVWSKLKLSFLDPAYTSLYSSISRHYEKYNALPSFEELDLVCREGASQKTLAIIRLIDEPDIDATVAMDALIDQYTQDLTLGMLDKFVDKITVYDTDEIKSNLSNIVMKLDEKTLTTEGVYSMADIMLFKEADEISKDRAFLGINNMFDSVLNGVAREELILIGGERGSGKSITACNVGANQYESGNSTVIFTIEMLAREMTERTQAILAEVPYLELRNGTLSNEDWLKVVKSRAGMFQNSDDLVDQYLVHRNRFKFEQDLVRSKSLKEDNQIIIIDNRSLTISAIDLHLGKLKARFGDKFKIAVVDYLNQIVHGNHDSSGGQYDWKVQIEISKGLKDLARKHGVVIYCPYQIDSSGEARFAKGILDAADIAMLMKPGKKEEGIIDFETTKIRGGPPMHFSSKIDWTSLRIYPENVSAPPKTEKASKKDKSGETDIPWN